MKLNLVLALLGLGMAAPRMLAQETNQAGKTASQAEELAVSSMRFSRLQAVAEALAHNPAITAAREQVAEAKAGITIAKQWPDPSLVTEEDQLTSFANPRSATEHDVGVQFTVPFPYRTHLNGRVARATWQQAQYSLTQLQQLTASQTAQAYDAILVALRHRDDLTESREMSRQFLEKTEARFKAGTVAKMDELKARVDLSKAENDLIANGRMITTARAALNKLLGKSLKAEVQPTDTLDVPLPIPDLMTLEQQALNSRPEIMSMTSQQKAARDSTTIAQQYWIPDLNLTLWRTYIDGATPTYKFDGGITIPLFAWQHKKGAIDQAKHHEQELEATGSDLLGQVLLDIRTSYASATTAFEQAVYIRDQLLPEAQAAYKAAFASYSLGGSSALDLLDAKGTLLDVESQYTDALGAVNDSRADLERAAGGPLPLPAPGTTSHEK